MVSGAAIVPFLRAAATQLLDQQLPQSAEMIESPKPETPMSGSPLTDSPLPFPACSADVLKMTNEGFLEEFVQIHRSMRNRAFCFVLGAGASKQSGIPTGAELAVRWLHEIHKREDFQSMPLRAWATAENLAIDGFAFDRAEQYYSQLYVRRFGNDRDKGYACLEELMGGKEPSYGYSVLAQILENTSHNVVITTNFDNLVADAMAIYTKTYPLVCGHESLAGFVHPHLRRPLVAKIHRDLLLEPKNDPGGTDVVDPGWRDALARLLNRYTPIVIGYGGNDGSLMGFLQSLAPSTIIGGIYWCYRPDREPGEAARRILSQQQGKLVPVVGFDELMLQLQQMLELPNLSAEIELRATRRADAYRRQFEALLKSVGKRSDDPAVDAAKEPVRQAAQSAVDRIAREGEWWAWQVKATNESDPLQKEIIYREGLKACPKSADLVGNFARFLHVVADKNDEAERNYRKAMRLRPNDANIIGNYAQFMEQVRHNDVEAERFYLKGLEMDSSNEHFRSRYAAFVKRRNRD